MRYSRVYLFIAVTLVSLLPLCAGNEKSKNVPAPAASPPADVLVIHDSVPAPTAPGLIDGNNILDLLGHFGLKGTLIRCEDYRANDLNRYRFVIMLSIDIRTVTYRQSLISDVRNAAIPVFWIGKHLPDLTADPQFTSKIGFRISGPGITQGFKTVQYKGITLAKNDPAISPVEILDSEKAKVMATAQSTDGKTLPYIVHTGNFWYCADSPFSYAEEGDRYLAFCDLLHNFFNMPHQEERSALVRLEDITPDDDPDELKEFADYLHDRKIPFQISLVPIYVDLKNPDIYLSDRPAFVDAIKYMVKKGGAVVMHGVTHQFRGKSTDDYELWNEYSDRPLPDDSASLVENKLRLGMHLSPHLGNSSLWRVST
jgi:uncharacterized protein YdaL